VHLAIIFTCFGEETRRGYECCSAIQSIFSLNML
jgi:hypothetical protein